jgi:hypothetical protein
VAVVEEVCKDDNYPFNVAFKIIIFYYDRIIIIVLPFLTENSNHIVQLITGK